MVDLLNELYIRVHRLVQAGLRLAAPRHPSHRAFAPSGDL